MASECFEGKERYSISCTPYQFTGQRKEAAIGLYDYHARFYDPLIGRFVQADTIVPGPGSPQSWDRYAYVNNNPINYSDPSGHWVFEDTPNDPNYVPAHSGINPFRRYVTTGVTQGEAEKIFRRYMKDPITDATPGPFSFGDHRGTYNFKGTQWSGLNIWHASYDEEDEAGIHVNPLYPGKVIFTGWTDMGNTVVIENIIYGNRFYSVYGHFGEDQDYTGINVNVGDLVSYTTVIGETGYSKPLCDDSCYKHLHFEVRKACNVNLSNTADVLYGMRFWAFEGENWKDYFVDLGLRWGYEEDNFVGHD